VKQVKQVKQMSLFDVPPKKPRKARKLREADVEKHLVSEVARMGGVAEKFTSPGRRDVPDRIVIWPSSLGIPLVEFVECKRPGEGPTPAQARDHARRRAMGLSVYVVDSIEAVDRYVSFTDTSTRPTP